MTLVVRCTCGEVFRTDEQHVGRRLRCRCGKIVEIQPERPLAPPAPPPRAQHGRATPGTRRTGASSSRRTAILRRAQPVLAAICWGYLAMALLVCGLLWGLGDRWWPATILLFGGRWILLTPLAVLLPASLLQPRLLVPLGIAALVILFPVMGVRTGLALPSGAAEGSAHLRVVTLNAMGGDVILERLPALLAEWQPAMVAFQECGPRLPKMLLDLPGWHAHAHEGLCLLSRYPIRAAATMERETLRRMHETTAMGGAGNVTRYTLATPYGTIHLTNLHLETPRKGIEALFRGDLSTLKANTTLREVESRLARKWVDDASGPTLVLGDFNTPPESRIYRAYWGDLDNAFSEVGRGLGATRYNGWIRVRIDHVLMSRDWRAERARVGPDVGSDHRPVIVDLRLRSPA